MNPCSTPKPRHTLGEPPLQSLEIGELLLCPSHVQHNAQKAEKTSAAKAKVALNNNPTLHETGGDSPKNEAWQHILAASLQG